MRGQEGDWWKGDVEKLRDLNYPDREVFPPIKTPAATKRRQDAINREQSPTTETMPQYKCVRNLSAHEPIVVAARVLFDYA